MKAEDQQGEHRHALVAGGRSGGHVFPGIALAAELRRRRWRVSFVGMAGGLEERAAARSGLPFHGLAAGPVVGASALGKLRSLATVARASAAGRRLVRREGVDVVVGLGGYVSVPAVVGARLAGRPILLFEPNATAGVANRWLSRLAAGAAVAHAATAETLHCPSVVTGTPVRPEFFAQPELSALAGPAARPLVLILGGSQGASQLNRIVPQALAQLGATASRFEVLHQCGPGHVTATEAAYGSLAATLDRLEIVPFLEDMALAMGRAHLVISRAGAITLAEICAVGRAAVLVPLEIAGGHQVDNAAAFFEAGAAELLAPGAGATELGTMLGALMAAPERLALMAAAARILGRPHAAAEIADRVVALGALEPGAAA